MTLIKEKSDNKIINLNPTFIIWDYDIKIIIKKYSIYIIIFLEILFIIFILYYFLYQELIFIYNNIFGYKLSPEDINNYNIYYDKIKIILESKLYCDNSNNLRIIYNGTDIPAYSLNDDVINGCNDIISQYQNK
ncbi:entry and fusion IMV protein (Cop-L5R) [Choristoneura rosaceana entomopoxvirus 'L']|uniref:Entry and fusion IMV protein (Cop-L5R) n=1 Tax=Choristoneura rosaceana entomopoxvirus 'L' TaxID=1293539 RepID=A0ABM9QKE4_9POXV|nr:entry and fusion IMV protein (Cop-L5R) [Choristoneura rosaceana entomopoxvirus 'L']CCU56010.1 entry and fusion IMV protein (Cop-L5R) [Choristoneura rosaceana entomopoxvirus 'L']